MKIITLLLLTLIGLTACGQKGPLYLPPPPTQAPVAS
ncbi:LPS translocon maturation chaperone LptM [Legionella beliardensis]|nr:lipoprotein [Legionella beliardensis]